MSSKAVETNLDKGVLNNSEWVERWAVGDVGFHDDKHDEFLDKREEDIFGGKTKSVFLPLCGKSVDMVWMYNRGHTVCGVEISEHAVKDFYEENNIEYVCEMVGNIGNVYKSKDGRLCLYASDMFDLSVELCGQFDVIWDSKSFVVINKSDRRQYIDLLLSLMKKDGVYYLSTMEYDPAVWPGPPHSVSDEVVKTFYSEDFDIVTLDEVRPQLGLPANNALPNVPESVASANNVRTSMPESDKIGEAIGSSSFMYFRWYKMTLKNKQVEA